MSLPVRKSCGIVDSASFLTLASICVTPPLLTSLLFSPTPCPPLHLPPPLFRLDTDGIDLLMSFLKVSAIISARHECCDTFCSYVRTVFLERSASGCVDMLTCNHTLLTLFFFLCSSPLTSLFLVLPPKFQYESKKRISADEAMRQPYFRSLGPRVHTLPESE